MCRSWDPSPPEQDLEETDQAKTELISVAVVENEQKVPFHCFFQFINLFIFVIKAGEVHVDSGSLFTDEDVPSTSSQSRKVNKDKEVTLLLSMWHSIFKN